jgi:hypothetical protein
MKNNIAAQEQGYHATISLKADRAFNCMLIVNPSDPEQSGQRLQATINAINENFNSAQIFLADTLDTPFAGTTALARKKGTSWIEENRSCLGSFSNNLVRWDEIREHPTFNERLENVKLLHEFDKEGYDERTIMRKMVNYALEEVAGLAVIREITPSPEIYAHERYGDPHVFGRLNASYIDADLTLPLIYPVTYYALDQDETELTEKVQTA